MRENKEKYSVIAKKFKISANRARQVYFQTKRRKDTRQYPWPYNAGKIYGCRINNVLVNLDIKTKEQAKEAIRNGTLFPGKVKNYGPKSHNKLCQILQISNDHYYQISKLKKQHSKLRLKLYQIERQIKIKRNEL